MIQVIWGLFLRFDEALTHETSTFQSLYGSQLIKPNGYEFVKHLSWSLKSAIFGFEERYLILLWLSIRYNSKVGGGKELIQAAPEDDHV